MCESKGTLRLFNLDLHISVITDVEHILAQLFGAQVSITHWALCKHSWLMGRRQAKVEHINESTWWLLSPTSIKAFRKTYGAFLSGFDGFLVTHTPSFCLLFAGLGKPIIVVNSCRYEVPFGWRPTQPEAWSGFNAQLRQLVAEKQVVPISNNVADAIYLELGTSVKSLFIESLCEYTGCTYNPTRSQFVVYSDGRRSPRTLLPKSSLYVYIGDVLSFGYQWEELYSFRGIVHIPYDTSTMAISEQYAANVPLVFPSKRLLKQWSQEGTHKLRSRYALFVPPEFEPILGDHLEAAAFWIDNADYYRWPHITCFDSVEELPSVLKAMDCTAISRAMRQENEQRRAQVHGQWQRLMCSLWPSLKPLGRPGEWKPPRPNVTLRPTVPSGKAKADRRHDRHGWVQTLQAMVGGATPAPRHAHQEALVSKLQSRAVPCPTQSSAATPAAAATTQGLLASKKKAHFVSSKCH